MKKGFTLIELLAVIIILAVIALIATPVVLNVVENATNEARKNSVRGYADSVRLSYAEEMLKDTGQPLKELATLKTQGSEVDCEYVKYDDKKSGTLLHSCKVDSIGNYCYINGNVYEDGTEECNNIINLIMSDGIPYNTPNVYVVSQIPDGLEYSQSKEIGVEYPSLKVVEEHYYIKSSESIEINTISKCGNEELPGECTEGNATTIEANTWYEVSGNVTFTINKNISIEAIIGNKNEYGNKKTYEVVNIDMNNPTANVTVTGATASIELSDIEGLVGYGVNQSTTTEPSYTEVTGISTTVEWTASEAGTYYAWVKDASGRTAYKEFSVASSAFCSYTVGQIWNFAYTGGIQSFTVPCSGTYKLEVWGAQGGTHVGVGGKGGYSYGNYSSTVNSILYIVVGGKGQNGSNTNATTYYTGGYNGGGNGSQHTSVSGSGYSSSGGGATHIATKTGLLSTLSSNKSSVLIVAGGGGGGGGQASWNGSSYNGGAGGGTNGTNGVCTYFDAYGASGGTQSAGGSGKCQSGSFGKGGNSQGDSITPSTGSGNIGVGGGGGWYGGGGSLFSCGGGGGSGYIGGVTGGSMSNGAREGHGYARITLVTISQ